MTWLISKIVGNPMVLLALLAAAFVTGVTVGSSAAWYIQSIRIDKAETAHLRYAAEVEQNAIVAKRAALDREKFWLGDIENARINAQSREARLKRDVANAQSAVVGLRNELGTLQARLATSTDETVLNAADSLGVLLAQCAEDYRAMAEVADRHASDVQTLTEAWPK